MRFQDLRGYCFPFSVISGLPSLPKNLCEKCSFWFGVQLRPKEEHMRFVPNYLTVVNLGACLYEENLLVEVVTFIPYQGVDSA